MIGACFLFLYQIDSTMNLHEYQAKEILSSFGVRVQRGKVVQNTKEALTAAKTLSEETGTSWFVIKAQIHAGGGYSVITSEGFVDGYGKVYLTHKFKANSGEALTGDFTGAARAISKDGDMAFASLQGIWKREGKILTIHTLDSLTNGTANYAKGTFDLYEGTLKFDVFAVE